MGSITQDVTVRGATATGAITHLAIAEQLDGKSVEWMEKGQRQRIRCHTKGRRESIGLATDERVDH
jgi:hypothetical protein